LACLALPGCDSEPPRAPAATAEERARAVLAPLKQGLMNELTRALEGGPENALDVCRLRAPEIAAAAGGEGIRVGRTSHRLRNPDNAPEPWIAPLLAAYVAEPSKREPALVPLDGDRLGYVEPITVQPLCLPCHGVDLAPAVRDKLAELYPEDGATGFATGDFRGLFWVVLPREPPAGGG
jgi:hypothetical protein